MQYRSDIDGLRAVAILAVLLFHADIGVSGGYVGVDVFFVISGYLITGLILKDLDHGKFHIVEFWERRIRRILPALATMIVAVVGVGWFLMTPRHFRELGQSVLAQAMLVSNIHFWMQSGYFDESSHVKPLFHTWSLAVEEQFYLIFPFVLMALRRFSLSARTWLILLLGCGSFMLCVYCSYTHYIANFYLLPMRAWELLLGAFLALLPARRELSRWMDEALSGAGMLAILFAVFFFDRETRFPGASALLPCGGAALLIWSNERRLTIAGRLLALPPVVFVGLISYSLYLWHWPVLVFAWYIAVEPLSLGQRVLLGIVSVLLAVLSWKFVEMPIRRRKLFKSRAGAFSFAAVVAAALLLTGLWLDKTQGVPWRLSPQALQYAQGSADRAFTISLTLQQVLQEDLIELGVGDKSKPVQLVVWGDSHAMAAMPALDALCKEHSVRGVAATHAAHAPFVGYESRGPETLEEESIPFNDAVVAYIRKYRVSDVMLIGSWQGMAERDRGTDRLRRGLLDTIAALEGSGARIWVMKDVPHQRFNVPSVLTSARLLGREPESLGLPAAVELEALSLMEPIFNGINNSNVRFLDPTHVFLTPGGFCRVAAEGYALYRDDHHLTIHGSMLLCPVLEPVFAH